MGDWVSCSLELSGDFDKRIAAKSIDDDAVAQIAWCLWDAGICDTEDEASGLLRDGEVYFDAGEQNYGEMPEDLVFALQDAKISYVWSHGSGGEFTESVLMFDAETGKEAEYRTFDSTIQVDVNCSQEELETARKWQRFLNIGPEHAIAEKVVAELGATGDVLSRDDIVAVIEGSINLGASIRTNPGSGEKPLPSVWASQAMSKGEVMFLAKEWRGLGAWDNRAPSSLIYTGALIVVPIGVDVPEHLSGGGQASCDSHQVLRYEAPREVAA